MKEEFTLAAILLFIIKELFVLIRELLRRKNGNNKKSECPLAIFDVKDRYEIMETLRFIKKKISD